MSQTNLRIKKLGKELIEWTRCQENRSILYEEPRCKLESALQSTSATPVQLSSQLKWLATWYANQGVAEVLSGLESGWGNIHLGAICKQWHLRVSRAVYLRKSQADRENWSADTLNNVCLNFSTLIALGDDSSASWVGHALNEGLTDGCWGKTKPRPFEAFTVLLFSYWKNPSSFQLLSQKMQPEIYNSIFTHWQDEGELAEAILQTCNYHIAQTGDLTDDETPEFHVQPYTVFPVEILSLYRIRMLSDYSTPFVSHPLLTTPLFLDLKKPIRTTSDQLIDDVIARLKREVGTKEN